MHRFARVIFGLMSRPCLRDTQNAFLRIVASTDTRKFYITKFLRDFCVDHLTSSFNKEKKAFRFYKTSNIYFFFHGVFELRKWNTNCKYLRDFINNNTKEAINQYCIFYFTDIINTESPLQREMF